LKVPELRPRLFPTDRLPPFLFFHSCREFCSEILGIEKSLYSNYDQDGKEAVNHASPDSQDTSPVIVSRFSIEEEKKKLEGEVIIKIGARTMPYPFHVEERIQNEGRKEGKKVNYGRESGELIRAITACQLENLLAVPSFNQL